MLSLAKQMILAREMTAPGYCGGAVREETTIHKVTGIRTWESWQQSLLQSCPLQASPLSDQDSPNMILIRQHSAVSVLGLVPLLSISQTSNKELANPLFWFV